MSDLSITNHPPLNSSAEPLPMHPFDHDGWRGWCRADWVDELSRIDPLAWTRAHAHAVVRRRPVSAVYRVQTARGVVYVKCISGRKDGASGWRWRWDRLRFRLGRSQTFRLMRTTLAMRRDGLRTPPIVLAARRRWAGEPCELLITEECVGPSLGVALRDAKTEADPSGRRRALVESAAKQIAELHRLRYRHGDLFPNNVLVNPADGRLIYLDNDRTIRWWPRMPAMERRRNLVQMVFRLRLRYGHALCRVFLDTYQRERGLTGRAARRERRLLLRKVRVRMVRNDLAVRRPDA